MLPGVGKGAEPAGKTVGDQTVGTDRIKAIRDPDERARVWAEAVAAAVAGNAELRAAGQQAGPGRLAWGPAQDFSANLTTRGGDRYGDDADDLAGAAADLMTAVARLGDGKRRHHRLTDAAEAFDRAARRGTRSVGARRMHSAARQLLSLRVALPRETREFLALIDQLGRLAQTLEQLRAAQGRAAQAAAARATQENLLLDTPRAPQHRLLLPHQESPGHPRGITGPAMRASPRPQAGRRRSRTGWTTGSPRSQYGD